MIRTLIVEDDFRVAEIHRAFVERLASFAVVGEARSAAEALDLVERTHPDLVLLDMYLPDRSGLDVLRTLHEPGRRPVDVIAITAAKDVETLRAALQGGVLHYLVKPFQFNAFREKLESYAAAHARLAQMREVDQAEIDRIYALLRSDTAVSLPKGLSPATLGLVARTVRESKADLSAVEVAKLTGISRVTSRRYLEHLSRSGVVSISMRYGSSGRPEHRYRWTFVPEAAVTPR
ncbi:MAG TPA: response regulator [Candidatus Limnocylindria bacterium]|jgi:two-component system CitB family response regulator|nr:response regulator [Candidatus Limnocylindria bacterium]